MKRLSLKKISTEAQLLLVGIPVLLWTLIPVYHMFLFAISERDTATSGRLWPQNPTLQNFDIVFQKKHFYLNHFWQQLGNSLLIALAVGAITLFIATCAAFAISRLKVRGGRTVGNYLLKCMPVIVKKDYPAAEADISLFFFQIGYLRRLLCRDFHSVKIIIRLQKLKREINLK